MNTRHLFIPALLLTALCVTTGWSQTTPTLETKSTKQRTKNRDSRRTPADQRATADTSVQDARYMGSSVSDGTATNNSNVTNYNSNNAVNNTTGAGGNPNTQVVPGTRSNTDTKSTKQPQNRNDQNGGPTTSGTAAAIENAQTTKTPAVDAGSTDRNVSIGDFIASSPNYTTLQNALQATGLDETLKTGGSYTLFAPSNAAFKDVPASLAGKLLEGGNRDALKSLLLYHVVDGAVDAGKLKEQIKAANGKATLKTMAGETLTATLTSGGELMLTDGQGKTARVTGSDKVRTNGVVHEVSSVLMSKTGASAFH